MEDAQKDNSDPISKITMLLIELKEVFEYIDYVEQRIGKNIVPLTFNGWKNTKVVAREAIKSFEKP